MTLTVLSPATEKPIAELEQEPGMHARDGYAEVKSLFVSTEA